jgi:hypothetical protein
MKRAVNNKRKSLSQTPVQKTTLLNFFPRTPGTSNATPKTRTLLDYFPKTPSTNQTPCQVPKSSSLLSTPVVRKGEPLKLDSTPTDCPGCGRSIPLYRLNEHLDDECPTSLKRPPRTIRVTISFRSFQISNLNIIESFRSPQHQSGWILWRGRRSLLPGLTI